MNEQNLYESFVMPLKKALGIEECQISPTKFFQDAMDILDKIEEKERENEDS